MSLPSWVFSRGREFDQGCQVQYNAQQRGRSDSMSWIVHISMLDRHVLCTAVHASVQHRISLYTPKSLHRQNIDGGRQLERGQVNGTLRYYQTHHVKNSMYSRCQGVLSNRFTFVPEYPYTPLSLSVKKAFFFSLVQFPFSSNHHRGVAKAKLNKLYHTPGQIHTAPGTNTYFG